jgi:hypothetical protein
MDNPEETSPPPPASSFSISGEAIIGIGMTIFSLGVLCLLLGWAQWMREVHAVAMIFLPLGAVLVIGGAIGAMVGHSRKRR